MAQSTAVEWTDRGVNRRVESLLSHWVNTALIRPRPAGSVTAVLQTELARLGAPNSGLASGSEVTPMSSCCMLKLGGYQFRVMLKLAFHSSELTITVRCNTQSTYHVSPSFLYIIPIHILCISSRSSSQVYPTLC